MARITDQELGGCHEDTGKENVRVENTGTWTKDPVMSRNAETGDPDVRDPLYNDDHETQKPNQDDLEDATKTEMDVEHGMRTSSPTPKEGSRVKILKQATLMNYFGFDNFLELPSMQHATEVAKIGVKPKPKLEGKFKNKSSPRGTTNNPPRKRPNKPIVEDNNKRVETFIIPLEIDN